MAGDRAWALLGRAKRERLARFGRTAWPRKSQGDGVGIVVVSYNTRLLTAHLIYSLYRLLGPSQFRHLVVVDNASTDGSRELLRELHDADLIHLIQNEIQCYHGPALTQGVSWLARRQRRVAKEARLRIVWTVDSDVVVLRGDTVQEALYAMALSGADVLGEPERDPEGASLHVSSLMLDPAKVWRPPVLPFLEHGSPSMAMQYSAERVGLKLEQFPFTRDGYLIHLGRGTLREISRAGETENRYHDWATGHDEYHFAGDRDGAEAYAVFCKMFDSEVGDPENLSEFCQALC